MALIPRGSNGVSNVLAGTGITVSPSSAPQPIVSMSPKYGGWFLTSTQSFSTTATPPFAATVAVSWDGSYGDTNYISLKPGSTTTFVVNKAGWYCITGVFQIRNINTNYSTFAYPYLRFEFALTRNSVSNVIAQNVVNPVLAAAPAPNATPLPLNPSNLYLKVGDEIVIQITSFLTGGAFTMAERSTGANDYDYNTQWNWTLLNETQL